MLESLSLEGKSVVITGGGTGLGREMVRAMARAGADLVIAGRRTGPIEEAAAGLRETLDDAGAVAVALLHVDGEGVLRPSWSRVQRLSPATTRADSKTA